MIYFGINILNNQFNIVALDDDFNFIAKAMFNFDQLHHIKTWVSQLKTESHELTKWYFDEIEFHYKHFPKDAHKQFDKLHKIYLVNHRKLMKTINCVSNYMLYQFNMTTKIDTTFFLAAADKIMDDKYVRYDFNEYMNSLISIPF